MMNSWDKRHASGLGFSLGFLLPPVAVSMPSSFVLPKAELEFLLYGQFRRNVSSAVALARFIVVFATHLNLDFTEFNFAVRMTLPACICISMSVYVHNERNLLFAFLAPCFFLCELFSFGSFVCCEDNLIFQLNWQQNHGKT